MLLQSCYNVDSLAPSAYSLGESLLSSFRGFPVILCVHSAESVKQSSMAYSTKVVACASFQLEDSLLEFWILRPGVRSYKYSEVHSVAWIMQSFLKTFCH